MVSIKRSELSTELEFRDTTCTLTTERIGIALGRNSGGFSASYVRPKAFLRDGQVVPVIDQVMVVRLVGLLAVAIAVFVTEVRR